MTIMQRTLLLLLFSLPMVTHALDRVPVGSGGIVSAGYDDKSRVMELEFKSGKVVQYSGVNYSTYDKLLEAEHKGKFFKEQIKGKYTKKMMPPVKKKKKKKKKGKKKKKKGKGKGKGKKKSGKGDNRR